MVSVAAVMRALWSRRHDAMRWFSTTTIVLGVLLLLFGILQWSTAIARLFNFWFVFFDGTRVAVLSLWATLYAGCQSDEIRIASRIIARITASSQTFIRAGRHACVK
jgi:hypothetical protein